MRPTSADWVEWLWVDVDTTTLFVDTVSDIVPNMPAGLDSLGIPIIIC